LHLAEASQEDPPEQVGLLDKLSNLFKSPPSLAEFKGEYFSKAVLAFKEKHVILVTADGSYYKLLVTDDGKLLSLLSFSQYMKGF